MKKLFSLFVALIATCALWASNVITYTSTSKVVPGNKGVSVFGAEITNHTFADGTGTITFYDEVTSIGDGAFLGCSGLTSITIPNSVTSIGQQAFFKCTGLTSITIPNSVTSIGGIAFSGCSGLISITIPNSVTSIGSGAFEDCSSLTSITIPNSVTSISAFKGCSGLTSITIPNSVTLIDFEAFSGCSGLTSITIGNSVTIIGWGAFSGCSGLTSITCEAVTPPACYDDFGDVDKSIPLYVPAESVEAYQTAEVWKDFTNILPIAPTALDNALAPTDNLRKFMRDGQVLIQLGDMIYNQQGQVVE